MNSLQALGQSIFLMYSQSPDKRRRGYIGYHELRRSFLLSEWESEFLPLEEFREGQGAKRIADMAMDIQREMGLRGVPSVLPVLDPGPVTCVVMPVPVPAPVRRVERPTVQPQRVLSSEECIQTSLF